MIDVIFTGGTIGSAMENGYITPAGGQKKLLFELYRDRWGDMEFRTHEPYYILSENMDAAHLNLLADTLRDVLRTNADSEGVIILLGSDTLQYTAAYLGLLFCNSKVPIALVCTNYILTDPRANGVVNFTYAVQAILGGQGDGSSCPPVRGDKRTVPLSPVIVPYKNTGEESELHNALSLLPHLPYDDRLFSLPYDQTSFEAAINACGLHMPAQEARLTDPCPVLFVKPLPGQAYPTLQPHIRSVLLDTYHSGTIRTEGDELERFCKEAREQNIPIYLLGTDREDQYESTKAYKNLGIKVFRGLSPITVYMLLWLNLVA